MEQNRLPENEPRDIDIESGNYNENFRDYNDNKQDNQNIITVNIDNRISRTSGLTSETNSPQTLKSQDYITKPSEKLKAFAWKKRPLLTYLTNREDQETILDKLLQNCFQENNNKPIVCIVHGDKSQGHDLAA